jgi:hypothetical protein
MDGPPPPRTARVLDALRGGNSHYPPDAERADAIESAFPGARQVIADETGFTLRVARQAAQDGISRLVYGGSASYLPGKNLHDAAQAVLPEARVIYVNRSKGLHHDAVALLAPLPGCQAAFGDSMHLMAIPEVRAMAGEGEPVGVVISLVLSFVPDAVAAALMASLAEGLPGGSRVALSVILPAPGAAGDRLARAAAPALLPRRAREDVARWLDGMDLTAPVADVRLAARRGNAGCLPWPWPSGEAAGAVARVR